MMDALELRRLLQKRRREIRLRSDESKSIWFIWRAVLPVSIVSNIDPDTILSVDSKSHRWAISTPRHVTIWLAKTCGNLKYTVMGRVLSRDHTSIVNSVNVVEKSLNSGNERVCKLVSDVLEMEFRWSLKK